jgi:hypothetical protein
MRFLGATEVLQRGFQVCQGLPSRNFDKQEPAKSDVKLFKKHCGSDPAVLARMWHDMGAVQSSPVTSELQVLVWLVPGQLC